MKLPRRFIRATGLAALLVWTLPLLADDEPKSPDDTPIYRVEVVFRQEGVWFLGEASVPASKEHRPVLRAMGFNAKGEHVAPEDPGYQRVLPAKEVSSAKGTPKDLPLADELRYYWTLWDDRGLVLCVGDQGFHAQPPEKLGRASLFTYQSALFRVSRVKTAPEPLRQDRDEWKKRVQAIQSEAIAAKDSRVREWLVAQGVVEEAELLLPRLADTRGNRFEDHDGLSDALEKIPSLMAQDELFGFSFGQRIDGFMLRASFDPAQSNVGQVAKAVDVLPGDKDLRSRPTAILLIRTKPGVELEAAALERIWKSLAEVEGVDVKRSRDLVSGHILGVVLKPDGKAKLGAIRAAVAGVVDLEKPRE